METKGNPVIEVTDADSDLAEKLKKEQQQGDVAPEAVTMTTNGTSEGDVDSGGDVGEPSPAVDAEEDRPAIVSDIPQKAGDMSDADKDALKEPEEPEHADECHIEQVEQTVQQPAKTTEHSNETESQSETKEEDRGPELTEESAGEEKVEAEKEENTESKDEKEGWVYVLGHDLLKKKTIEPGEGTDTRPVHGQKVTVRCEGRLQDGTVVDTQASLQLTLGDGDVIQALDLAIALMELNEVAVVETDAKYAFGTVGRKPDIPADAKLTYEVKVLEITDAPDISTLTIEQRLELGDQKRERGNYYYARGEFGSAINSYFKALEIVDEANESHSSDPSQLQKLVDARLKCHNNLAASQLKMEAWDAAIKSCDSVLKVQPGNVKALFRKGKCLAASGDTEIAIACLRKALKEDPGSKIVHEELSRLMSKHRKQEESQRNMYQKMLGTDKQSRDAAKRQRSGKTLYIGGAVVAAVVSMGIAAYRYMHW